MLRGQLAGKRRKAVPAIGGGLAEITPHVKRRGHIEPRGARQGSGAELDADDSGLLAYLDRVVRGVREPEHQGARREGSPGAQSVPEGLRDLHSIDAMGEAPPVFSERHEWHEEIEAD